MRSAWRPAASPARRRRSRPHSCAGTARSSGRRCPAHASQDGPASGRGPRAGSCRGRAGGSRRSSGASWSCRSPRGRGTRRTRPAPPRGKSPRPRHGGRRPWRRARVRAAGRSGGGGSCKGSGAVREKEWRGPTPLPAGGERAVFPFRERGKRRRSRSEGEGVSTSQPLPEIPPHPRPAGSLSTRQGVLKPLPARGERGKPASYADMRESLKTAEGRGFLTAPPPGSTAWSTPRASRSPRSSPGCRERRPARRRGPS